MSKVRNFSEMSLNIVFLEFNFYDLYRSTFEKSELGRTKKLLPLREIAENFGQVRESMRLKLGAVLLHAWWESGPNVPEDSQETVLGRPRWEGLFGTQKEHYDLRRGKARTKRTEILYIFFGIHTASVVLLAYRIEQRARWWWLDAETCNHCGSLEGGLYPRHEKQTKNPA